MEWQDAKSSMIRSFRYVEEASNDESVTFGRLEIVWANGSKGAYLGVNRRTYEDFLASESRGKFLNSVIKPGFRYEKEIADAENSAQKPTDEANGPQAS